MTAHERPQKVTLVRPPYSNVYRIYKGTPKKRAVEPPLGLLYLASALEGAGCKVTIIDGEPKLLSTDEIVARIKLSEPDFVGVTCTTPEFYLAKEIVEKVKKYDPNIITILGGAHVSALPEESLEDCPAIDYIVVGEGEKSIVTVVNEKPKERVISSPMIQDLDEIVPTTRHLIDYNDYGYVVPGKGLVKMDAIESARGCPFGCLFCFRLFGNKVRYRDPIKVVDEIEKSHRETGAELFMFFDDTFTLKKDRAMTICGEVIKRKLKLSFYCFTRVDTLSRELLERMKEAGFATITIGVESGNQEMLDRLRKGTRLEDYERVYKWMAELGIETRGSFIIGSPYENHQTIRDSINFAKKLPLYRIGVNIMMPYPGTAIYQQAIKGEGIRLVCKDWEDFTRWGTSVVETPELSKQDIEYYQRKFLSEFNSSPKVLFYYLKQLLKFNQPYYYFRPAIYAVTDRIKYKFIEFFKPHQFTSPKRDKDRSKDMGQMPGYIERAVASYKRHGWWGFVKAASTHALYLLLRESRFSPYGKGIKLRKGDSGRIKVLYVDVMSQPHARSTANGRTEAYGKVSTLVTFDYRKLAQKYGQSRMNDMLLKTAVKFQPDLVQMGKAELIYGSTIKRIKEEIDTCVIHFYGDFRWEPQDWVIDIGRYADYTLFNCTDPRILDKYRALGVKNIGPFWNAGADPDIFHPRKVAKTKDVTFTGTNQPISPYEGYITRRELVEAILNEGIDLYLYGNKWEYLSHMPNAHILPLVFGDQLVNVYAASKITLGVSAVNNVCMYAAWRRTFETMASGAFHLTHYVPGLEEVFENKKHLVWFNSVPEAIELIKYYLAHDEERQRIAEAGRQEVLIHHTWDIRIAELMKIYEDYKLCSSSRLDDYDKRVRSGQYKENPETDVDLVESMFYRWREYRFLLEPKTEEMYRNIAKLVKDLHVCDAGCGSGLGSLILAQQVRTVVGIEKIRACTEFAQKCFPVKNIKYINEDITQSSYPDYSFDAVIAIEVIEHISDYRAALTTMKRILKSNGKLYISTPNRNAPGFPQDRPKNKHHVREWTIGEFYKILSLYFEDLEFFDLTLTHRQEMNSKITPVIAVCRKRDS